MRIFQANIPTSLGDIIIIKTHLDTVKNNYDLMKINFHKALWRDALHTEAPDWKHKESLWNKYLYDIGNLFFSGHPYKRDDGQYRFYATEQLINNFNLKPTKPQLDHLLCKGQSLNIGDYIVITTKIRQLNKQDILPLSIQMWKVLKQLSKKYKIVLLGERQVEMRKEYQTDQLHNSIFSIYEQAIVNLPAERIIDLTVPALGETVSDLSKIQQDCLIMKEAEFVITLGIGGNFCMSTAVSNMAVGFRNDDNWLNNSIFNREYSNAVITKDWSKFIQTLGRYV